MTVLSTIDSQSKPNSKTKSRSRSRSTRLTDGENAMDIDSDEVDSDEIIINSPMSDDSRECFSFGENQDERKMNQKNQADMHGFRAFRFNIENDANLQSIINNNLSIDGSNTRELFNNIDIGTDILLIDDISELTSDYILSKLYNYMKISEMSKYGISVFEMTFSSYLPYLYESDLIKLASSYWCNGQHFNCMISHRGDVIKTHSIYDNDDNDLDIKCILKLEISEDLLDTAMQSGASVDKIEAMLLQKRIDNGIQINKHKHKNKNSQKLFYYHTKYERNFYLRNLKHRFWNHEVLVRVFIQNGWLTPNLADVAMKTFIRTVYHRVLQSKSSFINNNNYNKRGRRSVGGIKFSENFLHSFFVSYFCLDDIPKMYKKEISQIKTNNCNNNNSNDNYVNQISEETLRRWCELIELLASRGANINEYEFRKIIPLQYALNLGKNTYKIISSSHKSKNIQLIPQSYHQQNIYIPDDVWNILVSYL